MILSFVAVVCAIGQLLFVGEKERRLLLTTVRLESVAGKLGLDSMSSSQLAGGLPIAL
jgi:hypothetical protein